MKLAAWLKAKGVSRADFARSIGVSPGAVTQFCNQDRAWISRETATLILKETNGAVTPNDFLGLAPGNAEPDCASSFGSTRHRGYRSGEDPTPLVHGYRLRWWVKPEVKRSACLRRVLSRSKACSSASRLLA